MAKKIGRSGKKYGGNHTTLIPLSGLACDVIDRHPLISKIAPGFIVAGLGTVRGKRRIKITVRTGGLLLSVRDNASRQEVHVYTTEPERIIDILREGLLKLQVEITLEKI